MVSKDRSASRIGSSIPWLLLAAIVLGVLAITTTVWAVRSHAEVESLEREIAELRAGAGASVFDLVPTDSAPNAARGQAFINISGSGAVIVSHLPQPGDNEAFFLWYLQEDGTATAGGTLHVNENGQGFALIPGDTEHYAQIAISLESIGTDAPEGNYLLVADVRLGRG